VFWGTRARLPTTAKHGIVAQLPRVAQASRIGFEAISRFLKQR
jgi:hypothetical protein